MNNFSTTGYKDNSPDKNNSHNIIPGRSITMKGVSKKLMLIPIVNGQPQYDRKRVANPGDPDIEFEQDVEGVLEMPYAQTGTLTNPLFPPPIDSSLQGYVGEDLLPNTRQFYPEFNPETGAMGTAINMGLPNDVIINNTPISPTEVDPNALQKIEADQVTYRKKPFLGAINPYGGWNMNNASTALGAFIDAKNPLGIIGSAGKILLEGTRNAMAGAAAHKTYREAQSEYERDLEEQERRAGLSYRQKGGTTEGKMLTGNFIEGNDNHQNPNTEVEKGEFLQTPDGSTMEVLGDRHSTGGELLNLPGGTKVVSDYLKIGAKLATFFKKEFDLNVKSTSTFASVLDKYKKKIGLTELLEDEAKLMDKLKNQDDIEFEGTREINLQVLSEKINELQPEKQKMESLFENFTNVVFDKQESTKEPGEKNFEKQTGGQVEEPTIDENGQPVPQQTSPEGQGGGSDIEQLILAFCQITQQDPAQVIQQLQQLPEDQIEQAIGQIQQVVEQAMSQGQEEMPQQVQAQEGMMRKGGAISFMQSAGETPGKIMVRNADGSYSYVPTMIPQGKSVFGATDVAGEVYNPASDANITSFLDDAKTTSLWNPDYNAADLENRLKNAKTQKEKFDILNTEGQKTRQAAFLKNATDEMASYVGMGYAPVQSQLQKVYDSVPDSEKANFTKVLKDSGWGIEKGKVFGGNYKFNANYKPGDKLFDYLNTKLDPKLATEIGIQNINDGVYDRRRERFEQAEFADEKSMNEFATKNNFKTFKDKLGRTVWVDPNNRNNIILPTVKGQVKTESPSQTTDNTVKSDINPFENQDKNWENGLPMLTPDQSNLRPNFIQPGLRTFSHVQANGISISPEETLKELNKQYSTASKLAAETNPYTSGAMQADLQAKSNEAINQAYSQAALANAQDQRNVENTNEQRIQQRENSNIGALNQFEELSTRALDNYAQSWRNYYDNQNLQNVNNWNLENQRQSFNAVNDNFKIGPMGLYQTDETPVIYINGMSMMKDPKTGEYYEVKRVTDEEGKTTTTEKSGVRPTRKQKGGLLLSKGIKTYLK